MAEHWRVMSMRFPLAKVCAMLLAAAATLLLGGVVWLIGTADQKAGTTLLASVLTALVALGAYRLDMHKPEAVRNEERHADYGQKSMSRVCAMSALAILFMLSLFTGVQAGQFERDQARYYAEMEHHKHLAKCSRIQERINAYRTARDLAPLGHEMFCRKYPS